MYSSSAQSLLAFSLMSYRLYLHGTLPTYLEYLKERACLVRFLAPRVVEPVDLELT